MIITISNQKGGVGKTTTTMNVAACMTQLGHRVLLIDLDPQGNLTKAWGIEELGNNVYGLVLGEDTPEETMVNLTNKLSSLPKGKLHLIPGSGDFARYEKMRVGEINTQFDLQKVLEPTRDKFDYILLDCPPALGFITLNVLSCAAYVLVPMEA